MKTRTAALALTLSALTPLAALPAVPSDAAAPGPAPWLVADLSPGPGGTTFDPDTVVSVGDRLFFRATTPELGDELFVTDGTAAGTHVVRDIHPGPQGSDPLDLVAFGGRVWFSANNTDDDTELWVTDGTTAGTYRVKDINPGPAGSDPFGFVALDDRLLFATGTDPVHGPELWTTRGTSDTTVPVTSTDLTGIGDVVRLGTRVVLSGTSADVGAEPRAFDPETGTVTLLGDLNPGGGGSLTGGLDPGAVIGGRLVFQAADPDLGEEPWQTDGTPAGTSLLRDVNRGPGTSAPQAFHRAGDTLYFQAASPGYGFELWGTDGSTGGTVLVRDINPGGGTSDPRDGATLGDAMVFTAWVPEQGTELWTTRGSAASTRMVRSLLPGFYSGVTGAPQALGGEVFFAGSDGDEHGKELWRSDGTAAGTTMVADIDTGDVGAQVLATTARTVYFVVDDGSHGRELWAYRPSVTTPAPPARSATSTRAYPAAAYSKAQGARKRVVVRVRVTGTGQPAGKVTIKRGAVVYGTAALSRGTAAVRLTRALEPGRYRGFTATYAGSPTSLPSGSAPFRLVVRR